MHSTPPKHGFTLIELMIVISVITVLVALLLPALTKGKDGAQQALCGSNLKQLMSSWHTYAMDHKMMNVQSWQSTYNGTYGINWNIEINNYMGDATDAFNCPAAPVPENATNYIAGKADQGYFVTSVSVVDPDYDPRDNGGYGINNWLEDPSLINAYAGRPSSTYPDHITKIHDRDVALSDVPALLDATWVDVGWPDDGDTLPPTLDDPHGYVGGHGWMARATLARHHEGINIGFLDGSMRHKRADALWQLKWHKSFETQEEP